MYITLKSYLDRLKEAEQAKPDHEQRHVPNLSELADDIGLTRAAVSYIATNKVNQLNLETGGKIIAAMRARGFPMEITDLLAYRPPAGG